MLVDYGLGKTFDSQHFEIFFFFIFSENRIRHFKQIFTVESCVLRKIRKYFKIDWPREW